MRCTLLAGLLVLVACRPSGQTFVIAGQSNAAGRSTLEAPVPLPTVDGWTGWARTGWGEVREAVDPLGSQSSARRSPWPFFVEARLLAGRPTPYLVQTAEGSSCLAARDGRENRWAPQAGDLYQRMLDRMADARAQRFPRAVAVLWHQGECEASQNELQGSAIRSAYRDALMDLADAVGADLGVPIVAALVVPVNGRFVAIREAVVDAAALHPGILVGPDVADLEHEPDGLHVRDVITLGARWAEAVAAAGW